MLKIAELLAKKINCDFLITGDNLGQVASQTLLNLFAEDYFINIPVIRPLICFDKEEIVKIARNIGTLEISIESDEGCKIVPKNPITQAKIEKIKEIKVDDAINEIKVLKL